MRTIDEPLVLDPCMAEDIDTITPQMTDILQWYLEDRSRITTFMDFRVDWAFKYILGHKPILRKLLNDILPIEVADIEYLRNEIPVLSEKEKRSVFDVICTQRDTGEKFLLEMQRIQELDMDDRLIYYGASLLHNQIKRGDRVYSLRPVYVVCIADYYRRHDESAVPEGKLLFHYALRETEMDEVFNGNRLQLYILELPRLQKVWDQLDKNLDRWCFIIENLHTFVRFPENAQGFDAVFGIAQTGELKDKRLLNYLQSMITDYDKYTIGEYARREGLAEGMEKGMEKGHDDMLKAFQKAGASEDMIRAAISYLKQLPSA